jgi:uncharacterized membrane protein
MNNSSSTNIKIGSALAIVGITCLLLSVSIYQNNFYLITSCLLIEFVGVFLIIRQRFIDKETKKLIAPVIGVAIIFVMLGIYLIWFDPSIA